MKKLYLLPIIILLLCSCKQKSGENQSDNARSTKAQSQEWLQLFNGKDLEGWTIKINKHPLGENYNNTFRVEDGLLITRYDEYESFDGEYGHIFYKNPYSHYKLRVEYRIVGEQVPGGAGWAIKNSGVMFHAQSPESMLQNQEFPVSIEAQFLGGTGRR